MAGKMIGDSECHRRHVEAPGPNSAASISSPTTTTRLERPMATVLYHCPCTSVPSTSAVVVTSVAGTPLVAPPPQHPSHQFGFHKLPNLYFCEECDAIRCNRCVSIEVSGYYCPNCLFEVPSASVRAEKNRYVFLSDVKESEVFNLMIVCIRCARNCFQCPHCSNTLSIVSSDPPPNPDPRLPPVVGAVGEPPFFLYCNFCRWDSAEAGITFDKPTGLACMYFICYIVKYLLMDMIPFSTAAKDRGYVC